jgi:hypothetical protein
MEQMKKEILVEDQQTQIFSLSLYSVCYLNTEELHLTGRNLSAQRENKNI